MTSLYPDKEQWRGHPLTERLHGIAERLHVNHPDFIRAAREIRRQSRRCLNEGKGAAMLLLSPSGGGKTHLRNFFKKMSPDHWTDDGVQIPVVAFDIPTSPTTRSMGQAFLRSIGDGKWKSGTASVLLSRILEKCPHIGTEIIFIDNVHDIAEKLRDRGILEIGGWIRRLIDDGKRLVVLLGTPAAEPILELNSQLRRRTAKRIQMDYFQFETPKQQSRFFRFLKEVDKSLPLAELSHLHIPSIAQKIHWATFGIQDHIFQLLIESVGVAVGKGKECIDISDLRDGFNLVWQDTANGINPFSEEGPQRPLTKEGEPFFNWYDYSNPPLLKSLSLPLAASTE